MVVPVHEVPKYKMRRMIHTSSLAVPRNRGRGRKYLQQRVPVGITGAWISTRRLEARWVIHLALGAGDKMGQGLRSHCLLWG